MHLPKLIPGLALLGLLAAFSASCSAATTTLPGSLTPTDSPPTLPPYQTRTPTIDPSALAAMAPSLTPSPIPSPTATVTPTPRTYTIKAGDDMGSIALRYRVNLDDLKTANPSVNPRLLKVGSVLVIPGTEPVPAPLAPQDSPSPTALPVAFSPVRCLRSAEGGAACFVSVRNQLPSALEGLTFTVRLLDSAKKEIAHQLAATPLDLLRGGAVMPVMVYFAPPLPTSFQAVAELSGVLPASEGEKRYLAVRIENQNDTISPSGLAAEVSGEIVSGGDKDASHVWVAAVAYNAAKDVIGMRLWQNSQPLAAGGRMPFSLEVYSAAGEIAHVDLLVEARP